MVGQSKSRCALDETRWTDRPNRSRTWALLQQVCRLKQYVGALVVVVLSLAPIAVAAQTAYGDVLPTYPAYGAPTNGTSDATSAAQFRMLGSGYRAQSRPHPHQIRRPHQPDVRLRFSCQGWGVGCRNWDHSDAPRQYLRRTGRLYFPGSRDVHNDLKLPLSCVVGSPGRKRPSPRHAGGDHEFQRLNRRFRSRVLCSPNRLPNHDLSRNRSIRSAYSRRQQRGV